MKRAGSPYSGKRSATGQRNQVTVLGLIAFRGVREYEAALQINPRSAEVRNNLGLALMAQGEFASAAEELTQALALKPGLAEVRLNLAIAYLNQGRRAEAASQTPDAYLQVRPANDLTRQILAQLQGK